MLVKEIWGDRAGGRAALCCTDLLDDLNVLEVVEDLLHDVFVHARSTQERNVLVAVVRDVTHSQQHLL